MLHFIHGISLSFVLSGFGVGFLVGLTGVGGGSLMTPVLILFGISPEKAVTTDLLYAAITKTGGSLVHAFNRTIDWKIVRRLATGSLPGAVATLTAFYFLKVDPKTVNGLITHVLAIALLLTSFALLFRPWLLITYERRVGALDEPTTRKLTIAVGFALGVLVSISSVGAGALGVTALIVLYPGIPTVKIAASDIAHAVPLTLVAGIGHLVMLGVTNDPINGDVLVSLLVGSLPGIFISSNLAPKVPDPALRIMLAVVLILVAIQLLSR